LTVDINTYVAPALECVYDDSSEALRSHWARIEDCIALTLPTPCVGDWPSPYLRIGSSDPRRGETVRTTAAPFPPVGTRAVEPEAGVLHDNPLGRLRAMDRLGVSMHVISPALRLDVDDAIGSHVSRMLLDAYNRYVVGYCEPAPHRLRAVVQLHGHEPHWSADQLVGASASPAVAACSVRLAPRIAPDSRHFAPIWQAMERTEMPLLHRPTSDSPSWTPRRLLSYLASTGILDRHEGVKLIFAGWPAGWLADWCEAPRSSLVRYASEGRVFAGIGATESAEDVRRIVDAAGDSWLLWQTGFPFGSDGDADQAFLTEGTRSRLLSEHTLACLQH
jgi:hypothetical protein